MLKTLLVVGVVGSVLFVGWEWYKSYQRQQKTAQVIKLFILNENNKLQSNGTSCEFLLYDTSTRHTHDKNIIMTQLEGFKACNNSTTEFVKRIFYVEGIDGYAQTIPAAQLMIAKSKQ